MRNKNTIISLGVIFFMVFIDFIWCSSLYDIYTNGAKTFFLENRWDDIIRMIPISIKEEIIWRFTPFMALSIVIILLRNTYQNHKKILHTFCTLIIVAIQIYFGYAHYLPPFEDSDWAIKHIVIQGFSGICFAITYSAILYINLHNNNVNQLSFDKRLFVSHFLALISSSSAHILFNTLIIIDQTF